MKIDEIRADRIKTVGQPYHGLWKAGSIALPNSTSKDCPAPAGGGVVLLRVPGQPAVSRTAPELAADTAAGREWRNYGLISGGRYGASEPLNGPPGTASVVFIDAANVTWLMHITWLSGNTYMTVKLRRFGHFAAPWEEAAWSSPINVTTYPYFDPMASGRSLLCVCQNTTGREFILGSVSLGSANDYCYGLLKIEVSGTVDLSASGFGITFTGTLIGGPGFESGTKTVHSEASGDLVVVQTDLFDEYYNGDLTDVVITRTTTTTNDGTPVVSYSPYPAINGGGYTYTIYADPTWAGSGTRSYNVSTIWYVEYPLWAAYEEDTLKLLVVRMNYIEDERTSTFTHYDFLPDTHVARWSENGTQKTSCDIEWEFDGTIVLSKSALISSGFSLNPASYVPSIHSSDTITSFSFDVSSILLWLNGVQAIESPPVFDAPVVMPLTVPGVSLSTSCLACVSRLGDSGTYTWSTHKVIAPSGASQTTSIPISTLFASWQPVTDQLAVDSVPICWF